MDGVWITWREVTDGTDRVSSPVKPRGSHRGPVHHTESYIKGRRRRRPGQGLSYRSPDIWLSSLPRRQPATPVWQLYALHYCALMRSWIKVKIQSRYVLLLPISFDVFWSICHEIYSGLDQYTVYDTCSVITLPIYVQNVQCVLHFGQQSVKIKLWWNNKGRLSHFEGKMHSRW